MSYDNIILPQGLVAEIYKDYLVGNIAPVLATNPNLSPVKRPALQYLGKNQKNIIVLVNYPDVMYLPDEQLEFLSRILLACKLDIGDIAIINTAKEQATSEKIGLLQPKSMLIFGDCVSDFWNDPDAAFFTPVDGNGFSAMSAPALEKFYLTTSESKQLKTKLWTSLQHFFKL